MAVEHAMIEPHTPYSATAPHVIVRGEGVRVWDSEGTELLDGVAGLWCVSLGYSERRLIDAATRQLERLPFYGSFNHRTNDVALALCTELSELAPMAGCKVFLANSGSEANDSAIKLAWYYHVAKGDRERTVVLTHDRGYHGSTAVSASASGFAHMHNGFGPLPLNMFERLACPDPNGKQAEGRTEVEFTDWLIQAAEKQVHAVGPERISAVLVEPILGAGGLVIPPASYLNRLHTLLKRYGILLILDEVITAFGRTGRMFGSEYFDVSPDLITCAKGLSSAYLPISAVLVGEYVWRAIDAASSAHGTLGHGFTYSGHPVSAAVARETLRIVVEENLPQRVRDSSGPSLTATIAELSSAPGVLRTRSLGLLAAVDLIPTSKPGEAGKRLARIALEHRLIVRPIGDTLILAPPLVTSIDDLADMVKRLDVSLAAAADGKSR